MRIKLFTVKGRTIKTLLVTEFLAIGGVRPGRTLDEKREMRGKKDRNRK